MPRALAIAFQVAFSSALTRIWMWVDRAMNSLYLDANLQRSLIGAYADGRYRFLRRGRAENSGSKGAREGENSDLSEFWNRFGRKPSVGTRHRRRLNAERKLGLLATVSALALISR
jgi:hypothetical protein